MGNKFSEELLLEIYEKYKKGETLKILGLEYGINRQVLSQNFKKIGLKVGGFYKQPTRFSDKQVSEMHKMYQGGMSSIKIAEMYDTDAPMIISAFHRLGFEVRSNKENSKIYFCNDDYFENIDTQEKAYWLGFIYADGFITSNNKGSQKFGMSLAKKDKCVLEKLKEDLGSDSKIHTYKSTNGFSNNSYYCRLLITSQKMVDDLKYHGVIENKTMILKPPILSNSLQKHFIRGYMDGDGSIYKVMIKKHFAYHVSFVGTDDILTFIHNHLYEQKLITKDLNLEKRNPKDVVSNIRYGGNIQVNNILSYLYLDATRYLPRKFELYKELK